MLLVEVRFLGGLGVDSVMMSSAWRIAAYSAEAAPSWGIFDMIFAGVVGVTPSSSKAENP